MSLLSPPRREQYSKEAIRFEVVENLLRNDRCTHLGVGPMSKNCVDACIELTQEYEVPIMLIASRRQIECAELGGGYVNNWDTISFANYVRARDTKNLIILARDHGGPWQHPIEVEKYSDIDQAMESAKLSYLRDIEAGFQIIHIDPVINRADVTPTTDWVLDKIFKLYEFCVLKAREYEREIFFELGTEEQKSNPLNDIRELEYVISRIQAFCDDHRFKRPTFLVVQTGTKVMETRNIGRFPSGEGEIEAYLRETRIQEFVRLCEKYQLRIKEHNTDYLSDASLRVHPQVGIHSANVAPEFGVAETRAFLKVLEQNGLQAEADRFIDLAYDSRKWVKWVIDADKLSKREKAEISGHYVFSAPEFKKLKADCGVKLAKLGIDLDSFLKEAVKQSILRYLRCFNVIKAGAP